MSTTLTNLDIAGFRTFFRQILSGIGHLHHKKIIHRDIKLENILLDKNQTKAVIADFGLSNFWEPDTKLQTRCGSAEVVAPVLPLLPDTSLLQYAAPEIYDTAVTYSTAVDMWSLGVCLYSMWAQAAPVLSHPPAPRLTGRLPFEAEGDSSNHHLLIASIKQVTGSRSAGMFSKSVQGFTSRLICELGGVSLEAKLLLARLLTLEPSLRINVSAA